MNRYELRVTAPLVVDGVKYEDGQPIAIVETSCLGGSLDSLIKTGRVKAVLMPAEPEPAKPEPTKPEPKKPEAAKPPKQKT